LQILIAEDDDSIVRGYKLVLNSRNHELFIAFDGDQCVSMFDEHFENLMKKATANSLVNSGQHAHKSPFDLVILDYRMPKKDGIQVARHILSKSPLQRIIIASAYTHELITNQLNQNANYAKIEMLQKPFGFDVLLQLVEGALEPPQSKSGQESNPPENRRPLAGDFDVENRFDDKHFARIDEKSDGFFGVYS